MNRDEFFQDLSEHLDYEGLILVKNAYWLVKDAHRKQSRRLTGERYFEHVRRVANMLVHDYDHTDPEVIALALLHDVIEDTFVPPNVVCKLFGQKMFTWILDLSKEFPVFNQVTGKLIRREKMDNCPSDYFEYLQNTSLQPRLVKGCDRIDNLKDLVLWEEPRKQKYIKETEEFILPIIQKTDVRMANEIIKRLDLARV